MEDALAKLRELNVVESETSPDSESQSSSSKLAQIAKFLVNFECLAVATVEIHGEATKLMQMTRAATLLCRIVSPTFRNQIRTFLETQRKQDPDAFGLWGLCSYHTLNSHPWSTDSSKDGEGGLGDPHAMLCCIRQEFAFGVLDAVICEVTFLRSNGSIMYVEEVSAQGQPLNSNETGESSHYLGQFKTMYETARPFEISIETTRVMPVVACTEFQTSKALHDELARRAEFFKQDKDQSKALGEFPTAKPHPIPLHY